MWISWAEACEILGCSSSTVGRLIQSGQLTRRPTSERRDGSLDRAEVEGLAAARQRAHEELEARLAAGPRAARPPGDGHDWLAETEAAAVVGVSTVAIGKRARRGTIPYVEHEGQRWFRRDQMEVLGRSRRARLARQVLRSEADVTPGK